MPTSSNASKNQDELSSVEREVLELEHQYWQALKDRDVDTCVSLSSDPVLLAGPQGASSLGHDTLREMMGQASYTLDDFELSDARVHAFGDDLCVVAYRARESMTVDGKPITLEVADVSTWQKRDGRWLCVSHSEAILGDPFGRDRRAKDERAPGFAEDEGESAIV